MTQNKTPKSDVSASQMTFVALIVYFALIMSIGVGRGSSFLFIHQGLDYAHPVNLITWRLIFAGIAALVYILLKYKTKRVPNLKDYFAPAMVLALVGIIIPFYLTAFGQVHVESGIAGVLTATMPMISAILFAITTKTRVTSIRYLVMGFIGVTLVCFNQGLNYSYFLGIILILGSAFFYALNSVLVGNINSELTDKRLLACVVLIVAALISLLVSTLFVEQSLSVSREVIEIGAVLGVFCTTIPVVLLFYAINKYGTVKGSMGAYILPIVAVLLGVVFLNEEFQKLQGLGIIVILASVFGYARNK